MMDLESLEIFAELSVAMLGFSGITAVLGKSQSAFVVVRIRGLLFTAGIALVACMVPLTGASLELSSVLFISLMVFLIYWVQNHFFNVQVYQASMLIGYSALAIIAASMVWLAYSLYIGSEFLLQSYRYSICACLLTAGIFFIRVVLSMVESTEVDATK